MTIENEVKKLTAAVEANTAALLGGADVAAKPTVVPAAQPTIPAPAAPQAPATAAPIPAAAGPAVVAAPPVAPQPVAPAAQPNSAMTHAQAQAELGALVQTLGPADTRVQATMVQYGSARLNEIPAENLFSLVQACKALVIV